MPRKSRDEYDLRPNTHDKPNSQGTLFRAPVSARRPEMRQPRGYSMERFGDVAGAINVYNVNDHDAHPERNNPKERNQLIETLARSNIPVRDIRDAAPSGYNVNADLKEPTLAVYNPRTRWIDVGPNQAKNSFVLAHEVAHGLSWNKVNWHAAQYGMWDGATGAEEGQADAYAKKMSRRPGYKNRTENFTTGYMDRVSKEPNSVWSMNYTSKQLHNATHIANIEPANTTHWRQDALFNPSYPSHTHNDFHEGGLVDKVTPALPQSKFPRGRQ